MNRVIKYIFADHKIQPKENSPVRPIVPPRGIQYTATDLKHLESERFDALFLKEYYAFKGSMEEFISTIASNAQSERTKGIQSQLFTHNLLGKTLKEYAEEFKENEKNRQVKRSNSNVALHTIVSFSPADTGKLTNEMLSDFVEKYISLRSKEAIYLGGLHSREEHLHVHLIQSCIDYGTGLSNRISRGEFQNIKIALQEYQKNKYEELESLPVHEKSGRGNTLIKEGSKNPKNFDRSESGKLQEVVRTQYAQAASLDDFLKRVTDLGHVVYYRNGRLQGIKANGKTKHRLSKLLTEQERNELDTRKETLEQSVKELQQLRNGSRARARTYEKITEGMDDNELRKYQGELVTTRREFFRQKDSEKSMSDKPAENNDIQNPKEIPNSQGARNSNSSRATSQEHDQDDNQLETVSSAIDEKEQDTEFDHTAHEDDNEPNEPSDDDTSNDE